MWDPRRHSKRGEIPSRIPVDKVSNQLGKELIETMCALELCTLNGRFDQSKDNFTSVSCKGLTVVDYTSYSSLNLYSDFQVHDILDIIKSKDIPIDSTIPDHRLLTVEFKQPQRSSKTDSTKQQVKVKSIPKGYMQGSVVLEQLCMLADQLAPENRQVDVNLIYESFCGIIDDQLEIKMSKPRKPSDHNKPWWDENLKVLAKKVLKGILSKSWERNKQNGELKSAYLNSQKEFSKLVRKTKRCFRRERQLKLLEHQKYKPKIFWNFIKGIGSTTQQLPTSVCTPNGEVVTEGNQVLNVWRNYFCSLLCNDALSDEQNGFRTDRCCQDHIFALTSTIENRMARKEDTIACFIDFKKAFDCVNRDLLWKKLAVRLGYQASFFLL